MGRADSLSIPLVKLALPPIPIVPMSPYFLIKDDIGRYKYFGKPRRLRSNAFEGWFEYNERYKSYKFYGGYNHLTYADKRGDEIIWHPMTLKTGRKIWVPRLIWAELVWLNEIPKKIFN